MATIREVRRVVAHNKIYLTFDIDCLDPAFAPDTGTPVVGGLSSAQTLAIMRGLAKINFIATDVVEVAPAYDISSITAFATNQLTLEYLFLKAFSRTDVV